MYGLYRGGVIIGVIREMLGVQTVAQIDLKMIGDYLGR